MSAMESILADQGISILLWKLLKKSTPPFSQLNNCFNSIIFKTVFKSALRSVNGTLVSILSGFAVAHFFNSSAFLFSRNFLCTVIQINLIEQTFIFFNSIIFLRISNCIQIVQIYKLYTTIKILQTYNLFILYNCIKTLL